MSSPMDWRFDTPPILKRSLDQFSEGEPIQDRREPQYMVTGALPTQIPFTTYDRQPLYYNHPSYNIYAMHEGPQPVPAVRLMYSICNGVIGGILAGINLGYWASRSVLQKGYHLGRTVCRSRPVRQACSNAGIFAVETAGGAKRRAVGFIQPLTAWQERQHIHRASRRTLSSNPKRSPRPSSQGISPKLASTSAERLPSHHDIPFSTTSSNRQVLYESTVPTSENQAIVRPNSSMHAQEVHQSVALASPINRHTSSPSVSISSPPTPSDLLPQSPPLYEDPMELLRPHIPENDEMDRIARKGLEMELLMKHLDELEAQKQEEEERKAREQEEAERESQRQSEEERKEEEEEREAREPEEAEGDFQRQTEEEGEALEPASESAGPAMESLDDSSEDLQETSTTQATSSSLLTDGHGSQDNFPSEQSDALFDATQLSELASYEASDISTLTELPDYITEDKSTETPRRVAWKDCPLTGMPTDSIREYIKGEAMDYIPSSSPFDNSPLAMKQAMDSASSLEEQLAALGPANLREQAHLLTEPITNTHTQPPGTSPNNKFADVADEGKVAVSESGSQGGRAFSTRKRLSEIPNNSVTRGGHRRTSQNDAAGLLGRNSPIGAGPPSAIGNTRRTPAKMSRPPKKSRKAAGKTPLTPANGHRKASSNTGGGSSTEDLADRTSTVVHDNRDFEVFEENFGLLSVSKRTRASKELARQKAEAEQKEKAEKDAREKAEREAAEEAQRLADEEAEKKKRFERIIPTEKVIAPLNAHWEARVDETMALAYDKKQLATVSDGTDLGRKDFGTLLPQVGTDRAGGWLNDEIVNGYIQTVVDAGLLKTQSGKKFRNTTPKYHAFSTFFYKKLREEGPKPLLRWSSRAKVGGERLLEVERLFVPVHESSHWTLLVVSPMNKTIEYFDSMNGPARRFVDHIKLWLEAELGSAYHDEEWQVLDSQSPQQNNGLDCGVFAATTAKMIMMGIDPMAYGPEDIPLQRRRMVAELLNMGFHGDFAL
ncbi:MAG: Smt3-specific protease [Candelina submexicana]|nr:MAG: Smt3-specific protease [Candelina submexicana]